MNEEKENISIENKKNTKSKIILLVTMIVILLVSFIIYGIIVNNKSISNESELLSHLKNKYHKNFEIIELVASKQYETPSIGCDGSTFIPSKKVKGKYQYYYDVLSISDNIKFNVYLIDDNGKRSFEDSYDICKHFENTAEELQTYVISNIGNTNSKKESFSEIDDYSLYYSCNVKVYLDEKFEDIIDTEFIKKLNLIYDYEGNINNKFNSRYNANSDGKAYFGIYIYDSNSNYIDITRYASLNGFYIFDKNGGPGIEINDYMEKTKWIHIE